MTSASLVYLRRFFLAVAMAAGVASSHPAIAEGTFPGRYPWVTGFDTSIPAIGRLRPKLNARFRDNVYGTMIQRISESMAPAYGWVLTQNLTKFWVDAQCRESLQQRGLGLTTTLHDLKTQFSNR